MRKYIRERFEERKDETDQFKIKMLMGDGAAQLKTLESQIKMARPVEGPVNVKDGKK